jgi:LAS superfamily LD-carboxypeptidase LdcB
MLNSLELTGRAATHVAEAAGLAATLHPRTATAALALREAAAADGIDLTIVSSFRDFARQEAIWNAKYRGERPLLDRQERELDAARLDVRERVDAILLWSALPGASRHHWGTGQPTTGPGWSRRNSDPPGRSPGSMPGSRRT